MTSKSLNERTFSCHETLGVRWRPDSVRMLDETVVQLLELSQKFQSKSTREHSLKHFQSHLWHMSAPKLVSISLKYQVKDIFEYAFNRLIELHMNNLDSNVLTVPVWMTIAMVKEWLDLHCCIVACEPPLMVHLERCRDQKTCNDDWRQVWWNGVSQSVDLGRSNNPNTTPTKDYEIVRVVVCLCGVQRGYAEEGERGSTPTG